MALSMPARKRNQPHGLMDGEEILYVGNMAHYWTPERAAGRKEGPAQWVQAFSEGDIDVLKSQHLSYGPAEDIRYHNRGGRAEHTDSSPQMHMGLGSPLGPAEDIRYHSRGHLLA